MYDTCWRDKLWQTVRLNVRRAHLYIALNAAPQTSRAPAVVAGAAAARGSWRLAAGVAS